MGRSWRTGDWPFFSTAFYFPEKANTSYLLEYKKIQSTTDVINYKVTVKGKEYLHELHRTQLVFIKKNKKDKLLSLLT